MITSEMSKALDDTGVEEAGKAFSMKMNAMETTKW